jgi:TfoX/Sxy family transcriptional regulator of competence genes
MEWEKSPAALTQTFHDALPEDPRLERRQMFGYPCAFVGGNLVAGLHRADLFVRLPEAERTELLARPNARVFAPMESRPMREYIILPPEVVDSPTELRGWLEKALANGLELPAKEKKPAKAKKRSS